MHKNLLRNAAVGVIVTTAYLAIVFAALTGSWERFEDGSGIVKVPAYRIEFSYCVPLTPCWGD